MIVSVFSGRMSACCGWMCAFWSDACPLQAAINTENLQVLLGHYERFRAYYHGEVETLEARIRLHTMRGRSAQTEVTSVGDDMTAALKELQRQKTKERHLQELVAAIKARALLTFTASWFVTVEWLL